jgi:hypothetical protein
MTATFQILSNSSITNNPTIPLYTVLNADNDVAQTIILKSSAAINIAERESDCNFI